MPNLEVKTEVPEAPEVGGRGGEQELTPKVEKGEELIPPEEVLEEEKGLDKDVLEQELKEALNLPNEIRDRLEAVKSVVPVSSGVENEIMEKTKEESQELEEFIRRDLETVRREIEQVSGEEEGIIQEQIAKEKAELAAEIEGYIKEGEIERLREAFRTVIKELVREVRIRISGKERFSFEEFKTILTGTSIVVLETGEHKEEKNLGEIFNEEQQEDLYESAQQNPDNLEEEGLAKSQDFVESQAEANLPAIVEAEKEKIESIGEEKTALPEEENYYTVLGIEENAMADDVKHAFWEYAKAHHPDVQGERWQEAHEDFIKGKEAYETLIDEAKRAEYDSSLAGNE